MIVSKNYTYFKAANYLDQMAVIMLVGVLAADTLPTGEILLGAIIAAFIYDRWAVAGRTKIEFSEELDVLKRKRGVVSANFYVAPSEVGHSYIGGFFWPSKIFIPKGKITGVPTSVRSVLAHERAHASSADTIARFVYVNLAAFFRYTLIGWPIAFIYFTTSDGSFPWPLLLLALYYSPFLFFAYTKKQYLYRREFFADLVAQRALGAQYTKFLSSLRLHDKYTEGRSDEVGTDTHPPSRDRLLMVAGETKIPNLSMFLLGFLTSLSATFVFAALALNVTYIPECNAFNPNCEQGSRFDLVTFGLASFVFLYWFSRYAKILRSVLLIGKNEFKANDFFAFFIGVALGWVPSSTLVLVLFMGITPSLGVTIFLSFLTDFYVKILALNMFLAVCIGFSAIFDEVGIQNVLLPLLVFFSVPFLYISTFDGTFRVLGALSVLISLAGAGVLLDLAYCFSLAMFRKLCGRPLFREQWA